MDLSDAGVCPKCKKPYVYDYNIYAHLGGYRCSACGYARKTPDVAVEQIDKISASGSTIRLRTEEGTQTVQIALPAVYNVYMK